MDNDALYSVDQFKCAIISVLQGLGRFAPASIENGIGSGDAGCGRRILATQDPDKRVDRGPGVTASQRADLSEGFCHLSTNRFVHAPGATSAAHDGHRAAG